MLLYIEPVDTLFFRDNRPFEAGTDNFAESTMASPLTIYGAIGSYLLRRNGTNVEQFLNGKVEDPVLGYYDEKLENTKLKITGVFLSWDETPYLPPPANLYLVDGWNYQTVYPAENTTLKWDIGPGLRPLDWPRGECKPVEGHIPLDEIKQNFLQRKPVVLSAGLEPATYFPTEQRFGHRMDRATSVVEEGFLFSATHRRFKDKLLGERYTKLKLLVKVTDIGTGEVDDVILLGGEGKKARLSLRTTEVNLNDDSTLAEVKNKRRFIVYLLTPAIFREGWQRTAWPTEFEGASLVGAAVRKPLYISGWKRSRMSQGIPRPLRRAVPQGCVYFFQADNWENSQFDRLYSSYNFNKSLSQEFPCAGFGISLIGAW